MPPVPGCNWDTKPYYNRTAEANQLKGPDDRVPKKPQHNVAHREQWRGMLEWAARASLPCRVTRGVNLALQAFLRLEEHDWMLAVANLSADDLAAAEISLPAGSWEARRLDAQGNWGPAHMLEKYRLRFEIGAFSLGVFRCHPLG